MVNAIHFQASAGGLTSSDCDDFISALANPVNGTLNTNVSSEVRVAEIRFYNLPSTAGILGDPAFVRTDPLGHPTGSASATLPPQCAATVTFQVAARRHWGRIYLGGFVTGACSDGRIAAAVVSGLADDFQDFGTALRDAGLGLVVWNRVTWSPADVTQISVDDVWDVQRRRRYDHAFNREERSLLT
jgi:hypothetical protein